MPTLRLRTSFHLAGVLAALLLSTGCVRRQFFQPDARLDASQPLPLTADSVRGATAGRQYARHGSLYNALVGQHHRPTWAVPVSAPVLRLGTVLPGGLSPGKVGGGFNSTSLNLAASDGRSYVVRTVDKDPVRATPQVLRGTFLVNVLRDNISSTNPYAGLVVPPLAEAAGVPHANPRLFYVRADDPAFQTDSLVHFRGQLAFLEEKAAPLQPAPATVVNSTKAFAAVFASPTHRIDQPALLRARLLDGWMGDWDRHPGQWSWALSRPGRGGRVTLTALPKDRDMVFYRLDDGALGWLVGHLFLRHWVTFAPRYKHPAGLMSSGHYLDQRGLNELNRNQFRSAAQDLQRRLPDSLITRALHQLPPTAFALEGPRLGAALQARRNKLPALADDFYLLLAKRPCIGGTAQAERFLIQRYADSTVVSVQLVSASAAAAPLYRRAFLPAETRRIDLEALAGDDVVIVENHAVRGVSKPQIRVYGGTGQDDLKAANGHHGIRFIQESAPAKRAYDKPPEE
ncbi:hypothetical protein [Hymenobacter properus]|uniref:Uncharacterized protein n=1 Tax=Hymenobacter properus TaxID=2791026 RepID=A0A931FIA4_9BACT|nr:hypothetical protein [Hymenobacter properus]MBF9140563.1 hypothetical protein [Hymenobacter properus]MBR7719370.1 hypothetical protein [Microvirga sp. SRT04]